MYEQSILVSSKYLFVLAVEARSPIAVPRSGLIVLPGKPAKELRLSSAPLEVSTHNKLIVIK
jgi:hypothetical protein